MDRLATEASRKGRHFGGLFRLLIIVILTSLQQKNQLYACSIHISMHLSRIGVWRSLVAHLLWEQRVAGSNPAAPTIIRPEGFRTMSAPDKDYPALACPKCGTVREPRGVNRDGSVTYSCPPDHMNHGDRNTWRITAEGEMIEVSR